GSVLILGRWRMVVVAALAMTAWHLYALAWAGNGAHLWTTLPLYYTVKYGVFFALGTTAYLWRDDLLLSPLIAAVLWAVAAVLTHTPFGMLPYMLALAYTTLLVAALPLRTLTGFGRWGDFSYGMYLFAFPVQQTIVHFGGAALPLPADIALCFAITLCCAVISWRLVEEPALQLKSGVHIR
ncbi:MAG: hypothetical protein ABI854_05415, partial [Betaproteobacteria bacterium]